LEIAKILHQARERLRHIEQNFFLSSATPVFTQSNQKSCYFIFQSLAAPIRRRRLDLQTQLNQILDTCIGFKTDSISVQDSNGLLAEAWEALFILSQEKGSSRTVDDVVYSIAKHLANTIIEPILSSCSQDSMETVNPSSLILKNTVWTVSEKVSKLEFNSLASYNAGRKDSSSSHITGPICVLEWSTTSTSLAADHTHADRCKTTLNSFTSLLYLLRTIFTFLYEKAFYKKNSLSSMLGRHLFGATMKDKGQQQPSNLDTLLDELMSNMDPSGFIMIQVFHSLKSILWDFCIPDTLDSSVLSILPSLADSLRKATTEFEMSLVEQNFSNDTDILSNYAIHFEEYVCEKRRASILYECRTMLLKTDYHNTKFVGTDVYAKKRENRKPYSLQLTTEKFDCDDHDGMTIFILEKAAISQVAENLLQRVRQTMESAVDPLYHNTPILSYRLPASLYRTARELLDLYRFVIPSTYEKEISSVPRTAAIFYNDCVFLAHYCLTLGLEYKDRFILPESLESSGSSSGHPMSHLRETCTFVDLVPLFREMADRYMVSMIQLHKDQLNQEIGPSLPYFSTALGSNESVVEWYDAETALSGGLLHLRNLSRVWKGFLSHDVYGRAMGFLVDAMITLFLDGIFQAKEISEEACNFTGQLLSTMTRGVIDLFLESPMTLEEAKKDTSIYSRNWDRLCAVEKFLSMSLVDVTVGLSDGTFTSITAPELSRLVVAVYQDSEKRRSVLKLINQ
jgi:hypothetical protein